MNIYLEIFGYIGTALVLTSMLMTSVVKLRAINMAGSVISAIYAILSNTWPVVLLNATLVVINGIQLIRLRKNKVSFELVQTGTQEQTVKHFLQHYLTDIRQYFPDFSPELAETSAVHMVYCGVEPVGLLVAQQEGDMLQVQLDYSSPKYRDCSVAEFLFGQLKEQGIHTLNASADTKQHIRYLQKMGFARTESGWQKQL